MNLSNSVDRLVLTQQKSAHLKSGCLRGLLSGTHPDVQDEACLPLKEAGQHSFESYSRTDKRIYH